MSHHCPFCELIFANRVEVEEHVNLEHSAVSAASAPEVASPAGEDDLGEAAEDLGEEEAEATREDSERQSWFRRWRARRHS